MYPEMNSFLVQITGCLSTGLCTFLSSPLNANDIILHRIDCGGIIIENVGVKKINLTFLT